MEITQYPSIELSVDELLPNEFNPKKDLDDPVTKRHYEDLKRSLSNNGYVLEIIVRENEDGKKEIVDGYHRYLALKELGVKKITVRNLGKMSREDAIKKTLNIEKIKIPLDDILTAELIKELAQLQSTEDLSKEIPYTQEEIENKLKLLDFNWEDVQNEIVSEDGTKKFTVELSEEGFKKASELWAQKLLIDPDRTGEEILLELLQI